MARIHRTTKGTSGFPSALYRDANGKTHDAWIVAVTTLGTPTAPTILGVGAAGTTSYGYKITAISGAGETVASPQSSAFATGNATLDGTNYNRVSWAAVTGAVGYKVYGRTTGDGLLATIFVTAPGGTTKVGGGTINGVAAGDGFEDKSLAAVGAAPPGTGNAKLHNIRVPSLRVGSSGGTNWQKTGIASNSTRGQTNVLVRGR
jgi:hypothetical protein